MNYPLIQGVGIKGSRCPPFQSKPVQIMAVFFTSLAPVNAAVAKSRRIATVPKVHT